MKALDIWLPAWLSRTRPAWDSATVQHVMLAVCDHFEPLQNTDQAGALARVERWAREWPRFIAEFKDSTGTSPRHTFFYPVEQFDEAIVRALVDCCAATGAELEVHLHHDRDTSENLRKTLLEAKERLAGLGALCSDEAGHVRYGFIHGNWALDHSHPDGRHCGVPDELQVLRDTGCYADFTLPSAPNRTQTRRINSVYYAQEDGRPRSHENGRLLSSNGSAAGPDELLIVQGPLGLNWRRRKLGLLPRIENGDLTGANPPTLDRFRLWMDCNIAVAGQPNWLFAKLHTHGAKPANTDMLLGEAMRTFHRELASYTHGQPNLKFHYVTAREMVNIVHAAEAGHSGCPSLYRDFRYRRNA